MTNGDTPTIHERTAGPGRVALFSRRSPVKQTPNEDAALVFELNADVAVLAVADGCGGLPAGEQAAVTALLAVSRRLEAVEDAGEALGGAVLEAFQEANRAVLEMRTGAGTTLSVVEVRGRTARSYHAGDSVVLITGQRGRIKLETLAHGPTAYAVEAGVLTPDEAIVHEDRHLISNLVGSEDMRVDVGPCVNLALRDTLVLASDGLTDNLHVAEIISAVRCGPLAEALRALEEHAAQRMTQTDADAPGHADDLTVLAYRPTAAQRPTRDPT